MNCATEAYTLPCAQRDFVEWRKGRSEFAVWAIDLAMSDLVALSEQYRNQLQDYLLAEYVRQPHITLQIAGFPCITASLPDDFPLQQRQAQIESLLALKQAPFAVEVAGIDSFSSAPYFTVNDIDGGIAGVRRVLACVGDDDFPYTPHVTIGLYRAAFPLAEVGRKLASMPSFAARRLTVNKISLLTYQAAVIGGLLAPVIEFDLLKQQIITVNRQNRLKI